MGAAMFSPILSRERPCSSAVSYSRLRQGSDAEWRQLCSELRSPLLRTIQKILRNPGAAEDVLQDVFLHMFLLRDRIDEQMGSVMAWAVVMARNRAVDYLRASTNRTSVLSSDLGAVEHKLQGGNPERHYIDRAHLNLLFKLTLDISKEQQTLLALAYQEGMSHAEIAAHLSLPLGTVKTRVRNALHALRKVEWAAALHR
jgi:RNA polymerase sigma-70 factor (ECF subfamily)